MTTETVLTKILVVDDDESVRKLLERILVTWGYGVITAPDGAQAFRLIEENPIYFVISDWVMPELDGLELCKKIRAANFPYYVYLILLTAKTDKNDLIQGMNSGADDFISKPFNREELRVRISAGERVLRLEHSLLLRNRELSESNSKLSQAYAIISKDLEEAAKIQKGLLPKEAVDVKGCQFDWVFLPCRYVGGDIFNLFPLDEKTVGFYLLDVAGHGIPAAMLSMAINKALSPTNLYETLSCRASPEPSSGDALTPAAVLEDLNNRFQNEGDEIQYFTIVYGTVNTETGEVVIAQGGHPAPLILSTQGEVTTIGSGGFPVGMFPDVSFDEYRCVLKRGDRFFLYSDGVTEAPNRDSESFGSDRFIEFLRDSRKRNLKETLDSLEIELRQWTGTDEFPDDVSLLAFELV
jgi:sigma-B regulation protein RsbU (phosphoserine phosphatase)